MTLTTDRVSFYTTLVSLGKAQDRWGVVLPREVARLLNKQRVLFVTISFAGSLV